MDNSPPGPSPKKVLEGHFDFDPKDAVYDDHFPGAPVVPGSLIIHAFLEAAKARGWMARTCRVEAFRFLRFVSPGRHRYRMENRDDDNALNCTLHFQGRLAATGKLVT